MEKFNALLTWVLFCHMLIVPGVFIQMQFNNM